MEAEPTPTASKVTTHTPDGMYKFELGPLGALGTGAHGVVRIARHVVTGEPVAVKVMAASKLGAIAKELAANGRLRHPHIVELKATLVDLDRKRVFMVMELCRGGELFDRIAECGSLNEVTAKQYLFQIASALAHCHSASVYHRDLKPENILLTVDGVVKVCDFGLAATLERVHEDASFLRYTKCGSIMYAAPEVITSTRQLGYAPAPADVWSLGVIVYAMLTGALPFSCAHPERCHRFASAVQSGIRPACEANRLTPDATEMLCGMLEIDPTKRMTIQQVLDSSWLTKERANHERAIPPPAPPPKWSMLLDAVNPAANTAVDALPAANGRGQHALSAKRQASPAVVDAVPSKRINGDGPAGAASDTARIGSNGLDGAAEDEPSRSAVENDAESTAELGVNAMLVRSLGWVQLPAEKERMMQDVRSTLAELGASFSVVSGELSDIVRARLGEPPMSNGTAELDAPLETPTPEKVMQRVVGPRGTTDNEWIVDEDEPSVTEGRLTVRIQIVANAGGSSDVHFSREGGSILQFHSFYRDMRAQLAGANGWSHTEGRYHCDAGEFTPRGDES